MVHIKNMILVLERTKYLIEEYIKMAYIKINTIKENTHLKNVIEWYTE